MSDERAKLLLAKFFDSNSMVRSNIESFNAFIRKELQEIVEENKNIEPTIIPTNVDKFVIRLDKIWVTRPEITEADGSRRTIYPNEARLRKITYASPVFMEISAHINDVQRESFQTQIGNLPIMLKSDFCHLFKLSRQELIEKGEDPDDPGGYFIINGTEKVLIDIEDLASNNFFVDEESSGVWTGKCFSEKGSFKILHTIERLKDGLHYVTFTRVKRAPIILMIKACGLVKDEDIMKAVCKDKQYDEVLVNLFEFVDIKKPDDAMDAIAKHIGITQTKEVREERLNEILDRYLLPHIGITPQQRLHKAYQLCKMLRKFIVVSSGELPPDDKDHYMNKRLKMSGDLLADLIRVNLKILIGDLLYNFQRIVKRGKFPTIRVIIREKLLTSRIHSAMATGSWVGGRQGVSQRIQRLNYLNSISHLQRVVSPLSSSQENFAARELHSTHLGRLCPSETPEGTNIGLRKNLALMAMVSKDTDEEEVLGELKKLGVKMVV
ncbi:MAG: DNA-directed RNA polymerase subunit B'' [Nanoarchaeota archaeon]